MLLTTILQTAFQPDAEEMIQIDSIVSAIRDDINRIADNTSFLPTSWNFMDDSFMSFSIAILSFLIAAFSLWYTKKTVVSITREAEQDRVAEECQYKLFLDLIRHLYRNKVCVMAIKQKLEAEKKEAGANNYLSYPSEEHLRKLCVLPEDIHLELYNRNSRVYDELHHIAFLLRNYNVEIEVATGHLCDEKMDYETKARDLNTIGGVKPGLITRQIVRVMDHIWPEKPKKSRKPFSGKMKGGDNSLIEYGEHQKIAFDILYKNHCGNLKDNALPETPVNIDGRDIDGDIYLTLFSDTKEDFIKWLTEDVTIECGSNSKGSEKIHLIRFNK